MDGEGSAGLTFHSDSALFRPLVRTEGSARRNFDGLWNSMDSLLL